MSLPAVALMSELEARACVKAIHRNFDQARTLLLDLYEREGWRVLRYRNWRECAEQEFGFKQTHVYQLLTAAKIEREISAAAENGRPLPEKHLRPLAALETADERREVWAEVVATAPDGQVTERHVRTIVSARNGSSKPAIGIERRSAPVCSACAEFTEPSNWFVTVQGSWVWVGSESPPHLRTIPA